jgi:hypothetical protein
MEVIAIADPVCFDYPPWPITHPKHSLYASKRHDSVFDKDFESLTRVLGMMVIIPKFGIPKR